MVTPTKVIAALIVLSSMLGCGGGQSNSTTVSSQSDPTPGQAQGVYSGTDSNGNSFQSIILPNDTYWAIYGSMSNNILTIAGMLTGGGVSNNGKFNATVNDFYYNGTISTGALTASYVVGSSINGTVSETGSSNVTFNGTAMPSSQFNYDIAANLSDIIGTWTGTLLDGTSGSVTINSDSTFSGSSSGCSFSGKITPDVSGKNFFDVSLTYGASPCSLPNQTSTGVAVDYLLSDGITRQLLASVASGSTYGTVFVANNVSRQSAGPQWVQTVISSCNTGGSGPQCTATIPITITAQAGNTILVAFWYNSFPSSVAVSDSNNDTFGLWASVPTADLNDAYGVVYGAKNVVGGATKVNLTFSGNVPVTVYGAALEYSGVSTGIDGLTTSGMLLTSQTQGQTFNSGNFTTHLNNELAFGLGVADFGVQSNGWTARVGCTPQTASTPPYYSNSGYFCFEEVPAAIAGNFDAIFTTDFAAYGGLGAPPSPTAPNGYGVVGFSIY